MKEKSSHFSFLHHLFNCISCIIFSSSSFPQWLGIMCRHPHFCLASSGLPWESGDRVRLELGAVALGWTWAAIFPSSWPVAHSLNEQWAAATCNFLHSSKYTKTPLAHRAHAPVWRRQKSADENGVYQVVIEPKEKTRGRREGRDSK